MFLWILEVVQVNAHILYVLSHPDEKMPLLKFKRTLIDQLCDEVAVSDEHKEPKTKKGRPSINPVIQRLSNEKHLIVCLLGGPQELQSLQHTR